MKTNKITLVYLTHTTEDGFTVEIDRVNDDIGACYPLSFARAAEISCILHYLVMAGEWRSDAEMLTDGIAVRYWPVL